MDFFPLKMSLKKARIAMAWTAVRAFF